MAGPLYARYVPPKQVQPSRQPVTSSTYPPHKPEAVPAEALRKNSEDGSRKRKRDQDGHTEPPPEGSSAADVNNHSRRAAKEEKSALKRARKEAKKAQEEGNETASAKPARDIDANVQEENTSKKHRNVLSKFQRSAQIADAMRETLADTAEDVNPDPAPELHDLVPLPQPEEVPEPKYVPSFSTLPPWLAKPITVAPDASTAFSDLNIDHKLVKYLEQKNYKSAFAIQSAVLPLLLPGRDRYSGDICVSAATGSGKTLAYILPMVESMRGTAVTRLRGLIVVPTRELVTQAREVAELCASGTGLKIGTAVGNHSFATEQAQLVKKGRKYDPEARKSMDKRAKEILVSGTGENDPVLDDAITMLAGHVPQYTSKVDILICTPGRLVEHIRSTTGFDLDDVQWLIIDEADRLLDQSFQEWVGVVMSALERGLQSSARHKLLTKLHIPHQERHVTKVVLSATMTRDLGKLGSLKLRSPRLVTVAGTSNDDTMHDDEARDPDPGSTAEIIDLPPTLQEWVIPVGDGSDKPLYLLQLLQERILPKAPMDDKPSLRTPDPVDGADNDQSRSEESTSSEDEDDTTSDSETDSSTSPEVTSVTDKPLRNHPDDHARDDPQPTIPPGVLIFTSNNESATRLSRLLSTLHPPYAPLTATLTKSAATSSTRKALRAFRAGKLRILIASDRASRGLDLPGLAHIVNYDLPRSLTSYVHRVGRTARAGRPGEAWTLVAEREARWFWNEVARAGSVRRGGRVGRVKLREEGREAWRGRYGEALEGLRRAVLGGE